MNYSPEAGMVTYGAVIGVAITLTIVLFSFVKKDILNLLNRKFYGNI